MPTTMPKTFLRVGQEQTILEQHYFEFTFSMINNEKLPPVSKAN